MIQRNPNSVQSRHGRLSRCSWLAWQMVLMLWLLPLGLALLAASPFLHPHNAEDWMLYILYPILAVYLLVLLYFSVIFTIQPLHDLNRSGWLSLLILLPVINLIFFIYLTCAKGDVAANHYGVPRVVKTWEKFFAAAYVVLSLYLLAVFAIALYENHQAMLN